MALKLDNFSRGKEAIEKAAKGGGKGGFSPFAPQIGWKDGDEKFILFLNTIEEIPVVLMHEWIDCGSKTIGDKTFTEYYFGIARTDPVIGEDHDPLIEKGSNPKKRSLAVAVELEPVMKDTGNGRQRPDGFRVKTQEYERKTEDGTETVVTPVIGVVTQAQGNFYSLLTSLDESEAPIEEMAIKIKRLGGDGKTAYQMTPYVDQSIDFSGLLENVEGISYLSRNEEVWADLSPVLADDSIDDATVANIIAVTLLETRLNELADSDIFHEKTDGIEEVIDKFAPKGGKDSAKPSRPARPTRPSRRDEPEEDAPAPAAARTAKFDQIKKLAAEKASKA